MGIKGKKSKRAVRGPQLELVRERKLSKADAPFELTPMPSRNALESASGWGVASFRLSPQTRAELDALVAAHVAKTRADVVRLAVAALAKASKVQAKAVTK